MVILNNRRPPHEGWDTKGRPLQCENELEVITLNPLPPPTREKVKLPPVWKLGSKYGGGKKISSEFYKLRWPTFVYLGGLKCLKLKIKLRWLQTQKSHRSKQIFSVETHLYSRPQRVSIEIWVCSQTPWNQKVKDTSWATASTYQTLKDGRRGISITHIEIYV